MHQRNDDGSMKESQNVAPHVVQGADRQLVQASGL
jgi:hypothetical protein